MKTLANIALALGAASTLALGSAAFAQDSAKPEATKPESAQKHRHGHDKNHMRGMRGGCQGESRGEHNHS